LDVSMVFDMLMISCEFGFTAAYGCGMLEADAIISSNEEPRRHSIFATWVRQCFK